MADLPYMPFFGAEFMAATEHCTWEERGLYLGILWQIWQTPNCSIPNDDKWLARHFRLTQEQVVGTLRPLITEFCQIAKNRITQKRSQRERERAQSRSEKQSGRAKSRWDKEKDTCRGNAGAAMPTTLTVTVTPTVKKEKKESLPLPGEGSARELFGTTHLSTEPTKIPKGPPVRPGRPSVCPTEWEPTPEHHALGDQLGLTQRQIHAAAGGMRDWSLSGGHKKLDWNATFRNWLRRDAERKPKGAGKLTYADIARGDF